jgi:hypothetical protein
MINKIMILCELTLDGKIYRGELLSENSKEIKLKDIISEEILNYVLPDIYSITKQQIVEGDTDPGSLQKTFEDIKNLDTSFFTNEEIYDITQNHNIELAIHLQYTLKKLNLNKENISIDIIKDALIQCAKNETLLNVDLIKNDSDLDETQQDMLILNFNEILNNFIKSLKGVNTIVDIDSIIPDIFKIEELKYFYSLQSIILST